MRIQETTTIVTGGASGLGEACVRHIAAAGGRAAIFDLQAEKGKTLAAELGRRSFFAHCDITSEESVQAAMEKAVDAFGSVNVAINCAGGGWAEKVASKRGPASLSNFEKLVQINLCGTFNVIRLAVQRMLECAPGENGERGVIINTASSAAFEGQVGQAAYSASKAGVVGMTLPIARECADYGIRIMTIAPGAFDTPMFELIPQKAREGLEKRLQFPKRMGRPSEFAALAVHIIENPMLNGEVIRLSGAARLTPK